MCQPRGIGGGDGGGGAQGRKLVDGNHEPPETVTGGLDVDAGGDACCWVVVVVGLVVWCAVRDPAFVRVDDRVSRFAPPAELVLACPLAGAVLPGNARAAATDSASDPVAASTPMVRVIFEMRA